MTDFIRLFLSTALWFGAGIAVYGGIIILATLVLLHLSHKH